MSDEHLLQYPDGDTKYVHIGEDHATNVQYREYLRHISSMNDNDGINNNIDEIKETCCKKQLKWYCALLNIFTKFTFNTRRVSDRVRWCQRTGGVTSYVEQS